MTPTMIFHAPYPMEPNPTSASRLRPLRMREAFKAAGYQVIDLSGTTPQRRTGYRRLKEQLAAGVKPAFLYSENSTQPNIFATSIRDGLAPLLDTSIMATAHRAGIPVGVFYRDVYWRFSSFRAKSVTGRLAPAFHRLDLRGYLAAKAHFFFPSTAMSPYLGLPEGTSYSALPPAGAAGQTLPLPEGPLTLVYVGGLGNHYVLTELAQALKATSSVHLNMVVRQREWENSAGEFATLSSANVHPHHLNANQLDGVYARSHIGVLTVKPSEYWQFAVPAKLYEYLSKGRPILVTEGTEAARIVGELGCGWQVPYDGKTLARTLRHLANQPEEVQQKAHQTRAAAAVNTWQDRALQVATTLTGKAL